MSIRTLFFSCLAASMLAAGASYGQDSQYVFEQATMRRALVVANSDYGNEIKLPGTQADADAMARILSDAGFVVANARNVTRAEFLNLHLLPFLATIQPDDFVVFYFSGHGFSYGGENYLAPLKFPRTVAPNQVFSEFISMTSVQDLITERSPGFLLILLDACRNIAEFIKPDRPTPNTLEKALALMRAPQGNIVIGFSSDLGKTSIGSSEAGQLSVYTKALSKSLPLPDVDFDKVRKNVHFDVLFDTNDQQKPWFSDGSSAEIYFHPSQVLQAQEKEAWLAALATKDVREISRFLKWYSVSRFAAAARKWLADNKDHANASFSRISPLGPEVGWANAAPVKIARVEGPLAFSRVAAINSLLPSDLQRTAAELFVKHGEAVTTGPISTYALPDQRSKVVADLAANTKVEVFGLSVDKRNQTWAEVRPPGTDESAFIAVSPTTVLRTTDIGKPLLEVSIGPQPGGLKSLADAKPAIEALRKLQREGRSVQWISIATPGDPATRELSSARAAYLTFVLDREGFKRRQISVAEQASDLSGDNLRVRFFGN